MPLPKSLTCTACKHTYPEGWCRCPYCGFDPEKEKRDKQIERVLTRKFPRYAEAMQRERQKSRRPTRDERSGQPQQQSQPAPAGQQQGDAKKRGRRRRGRRRGQGGQGEGQQPRSDAVQQNPQREMVQRPGGSRGTAPRDPQPRREPGQQQQRPQRPPQQQQQQNRPQRPPESPQGAAANAVEGGGDAARRKRRRFRRRRPRPEGGGTPPQGSAPQE